MKQTASVAALKKLIRTVIFILIGLPPSTPVSGQNAHIIVDASRVMNRISPEIFGSCIEDVNHEIYGGLYSQRLFGESFEEPPAVPLNKFVRPLAVSGAWDPVNTDGKGNFALDRGDACNGRQSQLIERTGRGGETGVANSGLNRWGIAVRKGQEFQGRICLRAQQLEGPVTIALQSADGRITYVEDKISGLGGNWKKFTFHLRSNATDPRARFVLYIDEPGRLWADQAVLMPASGDRFKGLPIRADIASKMQEEGLRFLRYGGSMVNAPGYRWKNMTGDPDKRPPYKGTWYPYSTNGFGIEDFLKFCEAADFEPAFAINIEESPEDVAGMVEYLTGDTTTPEGKKRAESGHPRPYRLHYIEIGNEEVIGADDSAQYAHYINRFELLYNAIHQKNPGIQLVIAAWWRPNSPNMERIFRALDGRAAYWDLHVDADAPDAGSKVDRQLTQMQNLFLTWNPHTNMKCTIFEENGGLHDLQRALGHATILNAVRRHAGFLLTSCAANALQPLGQNDNGWDQGQIFFTPSQVWGMPPFYAQQMAAENYQPLRIFTEEQGALDVTATRNGDGSRLILHAVNPTGKNITASISLNGFPGYKQVVDVYSLSGPLTAVNTASEPTRISTRKQSVYLQGNNISYVFPAYSYTIIRFRGSK